MKPTPSLRSILQRLGATASPALAVGFAVALTAACDGRDVENRGVDDPSEEQAEAVDRPSGPTSRAGALNIGTPADQDAPLCSGDLAADTFRYGLCVCNDISTAGTIETASFRGSSDDDDLGSGGGVGVNGRFATAGSSRIDGTLTVGGNYAPVGSAEIGGELRVGGDLTGAGSTEVARDAYVVGDLDIIGLDVEGTLHLTQEPGISGLLFADAAETVVEDFEISAPCGCELGEDIAAFVSQARDDNDNASIDLDPGVLRTIGDGHLELPEGRYFVDGIEATGDLDVSVTGPSALYIDGDLELAGALEVELDGPDASLDIFLAGDVEAAGHMEIGSTDDPDRVRLYIAGTGDLAIAGHLDLGSALYAPEGRLIVAGDAQLAGSVLVGEVDNAGRLEVLYDADLQEAGDACDPEAGDPEPQDPAPEDPAPEDPAPEDPAPEDPAPEDPAPEEPAPEDGGCETFNDCPDPQVCIQGTCTFVDG